MNTTNFEDESIEDFNANPTTKQKIYNVECEIIAILLRYPELVLSPQLDINIFGTHKIIVLSMIRLTNKGITPDVVAIDDDLDGKLMDFLSGDSVMIYLARIQSKAVATKSNFAHWLSMLRSLRANVEIYRMLRAGMTAIEGKADATHVLGEMITKAMGFIAESSERQYSFTAKEMMAVMVDKLTEIHEATENDKILGIKTGISKLDDVIQGLFPTDMIVIGARPAVGKTAIGMTMAINAARQGKRIGIISTEMSVDQLAFRAASQVGKIDSRKFRKVEFDDAEWSRVTMAANTISGFNIRVCDRSVMRVSDVFMQCRAWDLDGGLDLVIVDYLTRIRPDKQGRSTAEDVGEIATAMKNIARELKIPVVVLAQLNRGSTNRSDQTPRMSDLRDSGVVEQEADTILLLHLDEMTDERSIIVDKNRHGESSKQIVVSFDAPTMTWYTPEY